MKTFIQKTFAEKMKFALVAVALVALAVFVVMPLLPQVESHVSSIGLRAGLIAAFSDGGGGESGGESGGGDCGSCGGDPGTGTGNDGGTPPPPPPPPPPPAPTCSLSANPSSLSYNGGNATLSWNTDNASSVSINQGVGGVALDGYRSVFVSATKTFTLTATGDGGTVTCDTTVTVANPPAAPVCTISASPNTFPYGGGNTTLSWTSQNAQSATINQGVGAVSVNSSKTVAVNTSKTFTLTVTGPGGTATCDAPVTVAAPSAPSCTISANPNNLPYGGGNTTLTWSSQNAQSASINQGIGGVAVSGSKNVVVTTAKTFTLTVTGPGGTATCDAPVTIANPSAPACTLTISPDSHPYGGGSSVFTWTTDNATAVSIDQGVGGVALDGSKNVIVPVSKTFTLTATGPGGTVTCTKPVTVAAPNAPSCTLSADPSTLPYGGGNTTLNWTSQNATGASLNQNIGTVSVSGSKNVYTQIAKTYVLTVTGPGGTATCEAPVTIATPNAPTCTLTASPATHPFGGGNSVLSWTTDNATAVSVNQSIGGVALDGSKSVFVNTTKTYTLTATGPGGTVTCDAPVTVSAQPLPACTFTASPNNFPYGGGNSLLSWNTTNADTVTVDQGIGGVAKSGTKNAFVQNTKTFTLTATNQTGSVTCTAPVTVGNPSQPTCALTVDPTEINNGEYARVEWSSTNVTNVVIKKVVSGVESSFQNTTAGAGSVIVSPSVETMYKGTFTGPGGSVQCQATLKIKAPNAPSCAISASPNSFPFGGGNTMLTWSSENATGATIDQGVGTVGTNGNRTVAITAGKTFKLTVTGPGGTNTCEVPVIVGAAQAPSCDFAIAPDNHPYGGGTSILSWNTENATNVSIDQGVGGVTLDGSKSVVVPTAKTFKLTATGPGGTAYCEKAVTVSAPSAPSCTVSASPSNLPYGGGNTTLTWTSQNATNASVNEGVGIVTVNGTRNVSVNAAKTFTLTVTGPGGTATCNAPVTISAPQEPSCAFTASPNTFSYGGGDSVLTWTTDNATAVSIDQGVGTVAHDGSRGIVVNTSKIYTLTATGPGGTKTCVAPVTVAQQPLPTCAVSASPNNLPYGGGNTTLTWTTQNADTVSIDQGVGTVGKNSSQSVPVTTTKTFTLTATNQSGSVTCAAPVTVGLPSQPTCALTVDPTEILSGNNARVTWSSTHVTGVVIKKVEGGNESVFQDTTAGQGSVIVSPTATTTYKGTFTGPGGTTQCEATLKVRAPQAPLTCDAFSISPSTVNRGDRATMTWNTSNAESVTINNGIGSVSVDGSRELTVNDDQGYTLTAIRGAETVTCSTSVDVRSSGGGSSPSPRCDLFKASDTKIKEGETVDLRWETKRGTKLEIEPNIFETTDDDEVDEGEVTVKPKKDTKYTLTVSKGSKKDTCTVKVDVEDNFTVLSARDQMPLTSISFTDIPYTGFDAGPFLTGVFYALLTLWSLAIAYVLVIKRGAVFGLSLPFMGGAAAHGGGAMIPQTEYQHAGHATPAHDAHGHADAHTVFASPVTARVATPVAHAPEYTHTVAPAQPVFAHAEAPSNLPTGTMPAFAHTVVTGAHPVAAREVEEDESETDITAHLENFAHKHNILLSSDALRMIIGEASSREEREGMLADIIERAKAAYPREDGWIVLNRERVNALFAEASDNVQREKALDARSQGVSTRDVHVSTVSDHHDAGDKADDAFSPARGAGTLAEAILTGNTTLAYQMLGESPLLSIADAAEDIDAVIRARKDSSVIVSDFLARAGERVADDKLKNAVAALVSAIDGTYADETAAVRLAVIKALKAVA